MPSVPPVVRHYVACLKIRFDSVHKEVSLVDLIHAIKPMPGQKYPIIREEMALYALMTDGRGKHKFSLELTRFDRGQEVTVVRSPAVEVDLGQDPTAVHGLPIPIKNVVFPQPGDYTFHLLYDGRVIAEEKIAERDEQ